VFYWERAMQLKRDALPALNENGVRLIVVGIGSVESGRTFSEQLGFPVENLFVDASQLQDAYQAVGTRNSQRDGANKQVFEGIGSMWSSKTTDAIKARGRDDLNSVTGSFFRPGPYKPLMPKSIEATLVQGGSFVFEGTQTLFEHYDESSGVHASIDDLVKAALAK
jgi:hypothetical protein